MITATSMPNLFSRDIEAAAAFYRDLLGFSISFQVPAHGRPEHVVLALGASRLALSSDRAVAQVELEPSAGNPLELIVFCDDVDGETARLRADGATVLRDPYDHVAGHRRAYMVDPRRQLGRARRRPSLNNPRPTPTTGGLTMILATGGTGTVGRRLVQLLFESGEHVRVLTRSWPKTSVSNSSRTWATVWVSSSAG